MRSAAGAMTPSYMLLGMIMASVLQCCWGGPSAGWTVDPRMVLFFLNTPVFLMGLSVFRHGTRNDQEENVTSSAAGIALILCYATAVSTSAFFGPSHHVTQVLVRQAVTALLFDWGFTRWLTHLLRSFPQSPLPCWFSLSLFFALALILSSGNLVESIAQTRMPSYVPWLLYEGAIVAPICAVSRLLQKFIRR